jgi:hypothetical protein
MDEGAGVGVAGIGGDGGSTGLIVIEDFALFDGADV